MQASNRLEHPVLEIAIGGSAVDKRPHAFSLITDQGLPSVLAKLSYPQDVAAGKAHDPLTVSLTLTDERYLLFTGEIFSVGIHGAFRELDLTDGYKKLCDTRIINAYRKETAKVILQDALDQAGIEKTKITCPSVEIARFSTEKIPADISITLLIKTLEEHGHAGLRFFFDDEDYFRFGTADDTGKNEGITFEFETGKNIFKKGDGWIEVLPLPIRHSQEVTVDGVKLIPFRTDLSVSASRSRLVLWLKETA
ncbi:hypothetical protein AGMMS50268_13270 [Spirochaetia bacterium]|nr:hypothetical protein AGMMS50233_09530 [Endomicrobiia bacterium]GHV90824.1 hypothetical protein AGMMS50268_13270 [Spirochaetia bacterium]